ncbi:MAG: hypothetical protein ACP5N2_02595 [Candidatus Nanoarchaeia archaeon]
MASESYSSVLPQLKAMNLKHFDVLLNFIESKDDIFTKEQLMSQMSLRADNRTRKLKPVLINLPRFIISLKNNIDSLTIQANRGTDLKARDIASDLLQKRFLAYEELLKKSKL